MLENLVKNKKAIIDKEAKIKKKQIDFIEKEFNNNLNVIRDYIKENNKSPEDIFYAIKKMFGHLSHDLYAGGGKDAVEIKFFLNLLPVKIGYYEIQGYKPENGVKYLSQGEKLILSQKWKLVFQRYNEI